jgi:hypothetical protein
VKGRICNYDDGALVTNIKNILRAKDLSGDKKKEGTSTDSADFCDEGKRY